MGGKASAEMANLYCYSCEAKFIDTLLAEQKIEEAKLWFATWRYIDDMLGFGERHWDRSKYGVVHRDTTEKLHKEVTFLGMKLTRTPRGLLMDVNPKGLNWNWKPVQVHRLRKYPHSVDQEVHLQGFAYTRGHNMQ